MTKYNRYIANNILTLKNFIYGTPELVINLTLLFDIFIYKTKSWLNKNDIIAKRYDHKILNDIFDFINSEFGILFNLYVVPDNIIIRIIGTDIYHEYLCCCIFYIGYYFKEYNIPFKGCDTDYTVNINTYYGNYNPEWKNPITSYFYKLGTKNINYNINFNESMYNNIKVHNIIRLSQLSCIIKLNQNKTIHNKIVIINRFLPKEIKIYILSFL
uniref:Uncharacterized protein n=1 Tax=viral metagenome TaxID=1070528 RepID=A0A6C0H805_9ZZZZ